MDENRIKTYDSLLVMKSLLKRAHELKIPTMNTTKAQKLMYCVYGVFLSKFNYRISNETPEAWQYGPVFPRTLNAMNAVGFQRYNLEAIASYDDLDLPSNYKALFDEALNLFGKFSASQLSRWSHEKGSPWSLASLDGEILREQMNDEEIRKYFKEKVLA